jgi:hypothetical protein
VYLLDIILLSTDPQEIYKALTQEWPPSLEFDNNSTYG